jgi:phage repressor protein C with HTH and peptisase S24 domain
MDWIFQGIGEPPVKGMTLEQPMAGYAAIPLYDVRARAGANGASTDDERIVNELAFREDWIRRELRTSPQNVRLIHVEGDSMEPDLRAGDIILVDHTDTAARREGVYVIRMDNALLVKALQRLPGGVIKVTSRNPAYDPFNVNAVDVESSEDFSIIGRVVWACRRF